MLLYWGILEPPNPSVNLAAVRFSSAVRVRSIRIFPTGAQSFQDAEDVTACTEPPSMYLDVFFNAQPVPAPDGSAPKQKASNALVPTTIAYPGGLLDFCVDMDVEFATRLMIIRGGFTSLTLAVYGETVQQLSESDGLYEPKQIPHVDYKPFSMILDPSKSDDPTALAKSLLSLIPNCPELLLMVRLMFCLKPSNEDWEEPDFPHLYADLEQEYFDLSLEKAEKLLSRPVSDAQNVDIIKEFALKIVDCISSYDDDDAYLFAKILSHCASQHPSLTHSLVTHVDLETLYAERNLDKSTLLYLLDASANLDIARQLKLAGVPDSLSKIINSLTSNADTKRVARRLQDRLAGWEVFEDALSNTMAPFGSAVSMMKDIALEEMSFGIWLSTMLSHSDMLDRLTENAPAPHLLPQLPSLWNAANQTCTHGEFIAFVRAVIGVAAVVAVYAWSDSVPIESCRERSLTTLKFWQNVDGYREIVNHLLLMRQMVYRLQYMLPTENDLPTRSAIDAEHMLKSLALLPRSMLRVDFRDMMKDLPAPLNYITNEEVDVFRRAADIARSGLPEAIKVVLGTTSPMDDWDWRLQFRVALAVVEDSAKRSDEDESNKVVLDATWKEGQSTLIPSLIELFVKATSIVTRYFSLDIVPRKPQSKLSSIFETCHDLLNLISVLIPGSPLPSRDIAALVQSAADVFVCTDSADISYSQESEVCKTAHLVRQKVIDLVSSLVSSDGSLLSKPPPASTILKALLEHASDPGIHDVGHHMTQVFWLFDHALPSQITWDSDGSRRNWVLAVMPSIVPQLRSFYSKQEGDNRAHLIRRVLEIDDGLLGVADWLLSEENNMLYDTIRSARRSASDLGLRSLYHWRIAVSLQVFTTLTCSSSESLSSWVIQTLLHNEQCSNLLEKNLNAFVVQNLYHESMGSLAQVLSPHSEGLGSRLRTLLLTILSRACRCHQYQACCSIPVLLEGGVDALDQGILRELGGALEAISTSVKSSSPLPGGVVDAIRQILNRVSEQNVSGSVIPGISTSCLRDLTHWCAQNIADKELQTQFEEVNVRLLGSEQNLPHLTIISSGNSVDLSLGAWQDMLSPSTPVPSTPKRKSPAQSAELAGMITVSPPNALLRSPEVRGLTKTYANNDFRQLRQQSAARQNTSRLPSMHVDDFEQGAATNIIAPLNPSSPIAATFPTTARPPSLPANPMTLMHGFNFPQAPQ